MAKGRIFISYRRGLDQGTTGRLYDRLERHYDREQLFMDVDDIPPGANFSSYLEEQIEKCDVFLIVIGKGWIDAMDRLQNADDFVRLEIEGALRRQSAAVIPVLLDGVSMPDRRDLPDSLHPLCMRQAIGVQNQSFATDVDVSLRKVLDQVLPGSSRYIQRLPDTPVSAETGMRFRDIHEYWCPEMIVVPQGTFMMGVTDAEATKFQLPELTEAEEKPRHEVEITQPFALARFATTFDEFDAFCDATNRKMPPDKEN